MARGGFGWVRVPRDAFQATIRRLRCFRSDRRDAWRPVAGLGFRALSDALRRPPPVASVHRGLFGHVCRHPGSLRAGGRGAGLPLRRLCLLRPVESDAVGLRGLAGPAHRFQPSRAGAFRRGAGRAGGRGGFRPPMAARAGLACRARRHRRLFRAASRSRRLPAHGHGPDAGRQFIGSRRNPGSARALGQELMAGRGAEGSLSGSRALLLRAEPAVPGAVHGHRHLLLVPRHLSQPAGRLDVHGGHPRSCTCHVQVAETCPAGAGAGGSGGLADAGFDPLRAEHRLLRLSPQPSPHPLQHPGAGRHHLQSGERPEGGRTGQRGRHLHETRRPDLRDSRLPRPLRAHRAKKSDAAGLVSVDPVDAADHPARGLRPRRRSPEGGHRRDV